MKILGVIYQWGKKEAVLCISAFFAVLSMFLVSPNLGYFDYIDWRVLGLLFCLMAVVLGLQECGLFTVLAQRLLTGRKQIRLLLLILMLLPFFSAMLVTNDVALITFVPFTILVLRMIGQSKLLIRVIVIQTIAANLGSMATPIGNPQNLYLYSSYTLTASSFFTVMIPLTIISMVGLSLASVWIKQETIQVTFEQKEAIQNPKMLALYLGLFLLCLLSVFRLLSYWIVMIITVVCVFCFSRKLLLKVDYSLLFTFICFFIFAGNMGQLTMVKDFLSSLLEKNALLTSMLSSQIISNVPAAVLLSEFTQDWKSLLLGVNVGGLGTPIASLASLISLKFYLRCAEAKPIQYMGVFLLGNIIGLLILVPLAMLL